MPSEDGVRTSWVSQIFVHPDWKFNVATFDSDVAVVVLGENIQFSRLIQPVCLPPQSNGDVTGFGTVVGWGRSEKSGDYFGSHEKTPLQVEIPAVNTSYCHSKFHKLAEIASQKMFCGGYINREKGPCTGDSGGGFYAFSRQSSQYVVKGIVSASLTNEKQVCDVNKFALYTNVALFTDWIEGVVERTKDIAFKFVDFECQNW